MRHAFDPIFSRPLIIIECNKRPLRCILDTGYAGTLWMGKSIADRYGILTEEPVYFAKTASGADAEFQQGYARILIDPVLFENLPIDVFEGAHVEYALLGTRVLHNFRVILDFKDAFTDLQYID
ncbi:retropepsin-like domain-containing protein [bacterium]|nr:retropepsin-like domain-containing protein [bacterium]